MSQDVPIGRTQISLAQLNERSREIFRQIVESYLATGEPLGSRNLSRLITTPLSPASVRNVMADLEQLGLIYAPHTSAGRLPTELGLRFFVDALMQVGDLNENERRQIEAQVAGAGKSVENVLNEYYVRYTDALPNLTNFGLAPIPGVVFPSPGITFKGSVQIRLGML